MGEREQNNLIGLGSMVSQQMGNSCCERGRLSRTGGGQDAEILCRWLTNNPRLLII